MAGWKSAGSRCEKIASVMAASNGAFGVMFALGAVGALAAVVWFLGSARRWRPAWTTLHQSIEAMSEDHFEANGAAFISPWYVSTPMVRVAATQTQLMVLGRWNWVPIPPTTVDATDVKAIRVRGGRLLAMERLELDHPQMRLHLPRGSADRLAALGWRLQ